MATNCKGTEATIVDFKSVTPEKVSVDLYGGKPLFGGREKPLRAIEVWCSLANSKEACPFRAKGQCLCVTDGFASTSCPYGRTSVTKGYTSRARKYLSFRNRYTEDPVYSALKQPSGDAFRVTRIGGYVAISMPYVTVIYDPKHAESEYARCRYGKDGNVIVSPKVALSIVRIRTWIPVEEVDASVFEALTRLLPRRLFDYTTINEYRDKEVPVMMEDLRLEWPEMYEEVVGANPELGEKEVDYRGRRARILTLKDGTELMTKKNRFVLDVQAATLTCSEYHDSLISGVGSVRARGDAALVLHVRDDDSIEVTDNDWVIPGHTVFV